jgi:ketosteroid isomerase-like protein
VGLASLFVFVCGLEKPVIAKDTETQNKQKIEAGFEAWRTGTGSPFDLLADDAAWTIVGNSPVSRTFHSKQEFMDVVITPFNKRLSKPLRPTVRDIYTDDDTVIAFFDAEATALDGKLYRNTYAWFMQMRGGKIVRVTAFFDTIEFTDFWKWIVPR